MRWGVLVVALQLAACVQSESLTCASGITCPSDNTCDDVHMRCLSPDQIAECVGKPDGTSCTFSGADGSCKASVCELFDCGNGIKEPGEQCDGSDFGTDDCTTFGYYFAQGLTCNVDCSFDRTACGGTCGDGAKNGNEQCDGAALDTDCTEFGFYKADGLACTTCQYDTTACRDKCGDGVKNGPELCDGAPPPETCVGIGFDAGKLLCSTTGCTFALDSCSRFNWHRENIPMQSWTTLGGSGPDNVWVTGDSGELMHFDGSTWTHSSTGLGETIEQLWVISPTDVWGRAGSKLEHFNGVGWTTDLTARPDAVGIWASGPNDVWAIGNADFKVQRWNGSAWIDGGTVVDNPELIHGSSTNDVWVAAKDGSMSHWNGATWTDFPADSIEPEILGLFVRAPNDAWAVGKAKLGAGIVGHWNGVAWQFVDHPSATATEFRQVTATAPNDVWIFDDRGGGQHFDGAQWIPLLQTISAVYFTSTGESFALSDDRLRILRNRGQVLAKHPFDPNQVGWRVFTTLDGHTFVSETGNGAIVHHDGVTWLPRELVCAQLVRAMWGPAGNDVWGTCGTGLLHWDGSQWKTTTPPTPVAWFSLWGSSSTDVWAGGVGGAVIHLEGGNWVHHDISQLQPGDRVDWITGTSSSDVWAGTANGVLARWNGSAWTQFPLGYSIGSMVATGPNELFITEQNDSRRTHRGDGTTWTTFLLPEDFEGYVTKLGMAARDDLFGANQSDTFVHFNGTEWTLVRGEPIVDLSVTARSIDYIFGDQLTRLIRVRPWSCRTSETGFCTDGIDNDCDGTLDSLDTGCP